jgi:phospholipid/cholesterol/gamma-HCH transport system substrate-binding protein
MDRKQALTWTELRVGVVVIASLFILALTILYVGGGGASALAPRYEIRALMSDVNGLKEGAPVRLGGVEVGTVRNVELASGGMIEVRMRLDRRVKDRITSESRATLGSLGMLGEKAVDLTAGRGGTVIDDDGFVDAEATDPFKGLLSNASDSTGHLKRILARMDAGEGLMGKALRDDELYVRMVDVSGRLQGVLTRLESERGPLGRLVNDREMSERLAGSVKGIEAAVARMEAGQGPLGALSRDQELAADLKSLTASLSVVSGRLQRGEGSAGRLLGDDTLYRRMESATAGLEKVLGRLDSQEGSAGRLLHDAELYENLNAASRDVRLLVSDIRRDPRKYLRVKLSLF